MTTTGKARAQGPDQGDQRIDPLFNEAFLRIFGGEDSKGLTRSLINSMLRAAGVKQIGQINHIEADHTVVGGGVECKAPRADVRVLSANRVVDLEAQTYKDDVDNRFVFYAAKLLTEFVPRGMLYEDLPQVVIIVLLDDVVRFPDSPQIVSRMQMQWNVDETQDADNDRMVVVLAELKKFRRRYTRLDKDVLADEALAWMYLLTRGYEREEDMMEIADRFMDIEQFAEKYGLALDDPHIKNAYEDYLSAERDEHARQRYIDRVTREAREEGFSQGRAEERENLVKKLRELGVDQAVIDQALAKKEG